MIEIRNIYYMLTYAFSVLKENTYVNVIAEDFDNANELYTAILIKGVSNQIKRGLHYEYIEKQEALTMVRGKIDISESISNLDILNKKLSCVYDEYSINNYLNQIIKSTMLLLINEDISKERKKKLKNLLIHFSSVNQIDLSSINWNMRFTRNNKTYKMLIAICNLIVEGLLQSNNEGNRQVLDFKDEQRMSHLYEKFLFEYFKKTFPQLSVTAAHIPWKLDDDESSMLPTMKSDIMISNKKDYLIIDAKFYKKSLQNYYDTYKIHSANLYQIFTYVKNHAFYIREKEINTNVSGMLLYAKTDEEKTPENKFQMSGNLISVKSLDLNCEFSQIKKQLNQIIMEHFEI
ncbi:MULTISPECIES: 5-methylcytosine-specific restriction endonuclease system specificity protein McrC [Staphylococcus]|uniref:5-methylcytosine-specific restriction endonuclease system specificity protein McrC n=1 Tax=Staphylococcus TaxID=1279 RepID=UPI000952B9B8|nr:MULTISPECIES: 5-methylcytosine-specific restriction endonuclease system specificity protein McrC [Staphylococcus]MBE9429370.1 5-methylcytosine-specific restriction endonuclease system specificity protein McrC [Staphylococcus epidermidis]AXV41148.1 putative restriction enzyme [Staphylococcus sp. M0911]OLS09664.1 restriction endonuclease [Staphylococcus epidermidis]PTI19832.1 5-methylcytosine-specific restriction endonuclease system specificity protein McrC [Staphylococcus warneri]PTI24074.1 